MATPPPPLPLPPGGGIREASASPRLSESQQQRLRTPRTSRSIPPPPSASPTFASDGRTSLRFGSGGAGAAACVGLGDLGGKADSALRPLVSQLRDNMASLERTQQDLVRLVESTASEKASLERDRRTKLEDDERAAATAVAARRAAERLKAECDQRVAQEQAETKRRIAELSADCERRLREARESTDAKLSEARRQAEAEVDAERRSTDQVRHVLRELLPLQAAVELGDLPRLDAELAKWKTSVSERFGESAAVVEAVVKLARERLLIWRGVERAVKDVLKQAERLPGTSKALLEQCQRLFRALKEAQLTRMDLRRSDPKSIERIVEVLCAWLETSMAHPNRIQKLIVRKIVYCQQLGTFDFADLDICLRLVDRQEQANEIFFSRARAIVEDESTSPMDLRPSLSHVETMLFFLKYTKAEDLRLAHAEFRRQTGRLDRSIAAHLDRAEIEYPPGAELVRWSDSRSDSLVEGSEVAAVLEEIRKPPPNCKDSLGVFRDIFFHWADVMNRKFDLLVLPHHTQVICLLAFRSFLEAKQKGCDPHTLVAQVGTGEGKSMIIAALALYVVIALGKKAHVIVDDETLLERDFWTFKPLFDAFKVPASSSAGAEDGGEGRPISARLCISEERLSSCRRDDPRLPSLTSRVDAEADICYCEAKHVQSFYASIARGTNQDFEGYDGRVLILDEVDAMIIDEEPNEAFVYPNEELSEMATSVAEALADGATPEQVQFALRDSPHPAAERVAREMCQEWLQAKRLKASDDFVYAKDIGRYCRLQGGRANPKAWSLSLECRNFQDGLCREIKFQERLFVMSRPRVFRKYHRILGLSGSIGSSAERAFLRQTYGASFFEVPPFLKTCRGSPFHEAVPVALGSDRQAVYIEASAEAQLARLVEVAFEARERVPVLVIARDRSQCDQLVEQLRRAARLRGLGDTSDDVVRSLSRTLYETDSEQWKDNLNRSTLPLGSASDSKKCWRITVTDPRGGRGTDYRVDDPSVDAFGGLLLLPLAIPTSQREWTQFLGRTARQDRRGQFCPVLCAADYFALSAKFGEALPEVGPGTTSLEAVEAIITWGDREVADRIRSSAALYNCGVRVNELCEEMFGRQRQLLGNPLARERLVDLCQKLRWMSVQEIDELAGHIPEFDPGRVPTEARDLGRPQEPPVPLPTSSSSSTACASDASPSAASSAGAEPPHPSVCSTRFSSRRSSAAASASLPHGASKGPPKVVIFCLDWSLSMLSQDTGTNLTRFGTCVACVRRILRDQVRDQDLVGVIGFGEQVETVVLPTMKATGGSMVDTKIAGLQAQVLGGTCFFDAVLQSLHQLREVEAAPEAPRWLVCLTDGDDLGSRRGNMGGELVTKALASNAPDNLNMVMITVGKLKEKNVKVIDGWMERVESAGGFAQHLSERNAAAITSAFSVVAQCLAAEVGGATEC